MALPQTEKRGGCLTAWIIATLFATTLIAIDDIFSTSVFQQIYPTISPEAFSAWDTHPIHST